MKKFEIKMKETNIFKFIIEAENEEKAKEKTFDFYFKIYENNTIYDYQDDGTCRIISINEKNEKR